MLIFTQFENLETFGDIKNIYVHNIKKNSNVEHGFFFTDNRMRNICIYDTQLQKQISWL